MVEIDQTRKTLFPILTCMHSPYLPRITPKGVCVHMHGIWRFGITGKLGADLLPSNSLNNNGHSVQL